MLKKMCCKRNGFIQAQKTHDTVVVTRGVVKEMCCKTNGFTQAETTSDSVVVTRGVVKEINCICYKCKKNV